MFTLPGIRRRDCVSKTFCGRSQLAGALWFGPTMSWIIHFAIVTILRFMQSLLRNDIPGRKFREFGSKRPPPSPKLFRRFPLLITHKVGLLDMDMGPVWYSFSSGCHLPSFKLCLKPSPSVQTSQERLREYFTQFGEIDDVLIMKDPITQVNNHSSLRLIFSVWWQFEHTSYLSFFYTSKIFGE